MTFKKSDSKMTERLFKLISSLNSPEECAEFFEDLCTEREIEQMAQRIRAAELLLDGKTYNQVKEECTISTATLSRVSRCVQYGKGYSKFLK